MTPEANLAPKSTLPIAISMGDPAGIGPEIIIKAWQSRGQRALPAFFILGSADVLKSFSPSTPLALINAPSEASTVFADALPVIDIATTASVVLGQPNAKNAPMTLDAIEQGVKFVKSGHASALVTAPINKHVLYEAGFEYKGHTDFLALLCGQHEDDAVMMLHSDELSVVPLTIHIALRDVADSISQENIVKTAKTMLAELSTRFGYSNPRVGVTGLNPHAGEGGHMGDEEADIIAPAIAKLQSEGHAVFGPYAADSLFSEAERRKYDAILAMYHDQALGPLKALDMRRGVNITLGLNDFIRVSPDHGTAYAIAGTGTADAESMIQAIVMARRLAGNNG